MSLKIFITGTDTGVGKTYVTVGLLKFFNQNGFSTIGVKPVASGGRYIQQQLINQDAHNLLYASSIQLDYHQINPFSFAPPIAPHIAAKQENIDLTIQTIRTKLSPVLSYPCDIQLIEGVGGWSVPLNDKETMGDFVSHYQLPIIMVVGIRLGCINHAILTYQVIQSQNLPILGWVANIIDKNVLQESEIIKTIQSWLNIPCLAVIPHNKKPEECFNKAEVLNLLNL